MKQLVAAGLVLTSTLLVGCGAKDDPPSSGIGSATTITRENVQATTPDPCTPTSISVKTDAGTADVDATTSYADLTGSGPQSLTLTLANYPIAERDARGVLQPSGLEKGKAVVIVTATAPKITEGTYLDQTDPKASENKVNFFSIYTADGRALPTADHELTITKVAEDRVCGSLKPVAGSTEAGASGSFTGKRIDSGPTTVMTSKGPTATTGRSSTASTR